MFQHGTTWFGFLEVTVPGILYRRMLLRDLHCGRAGFQPLKMLKVCLRIPTPTVSYLATEQP